MGGFPGIEGIIEKIDKLEDPGLPKDKGIRKCLEDFRAKLAAVVDMQTEAFKKVLEALKCANLLLQQICEDQNGLISNVEVMVATFGVGGSATTDSESATSSSSCRATLAPKPKFPIETSRYYLDTLKEHSDAYTEKGIAKTKYDQARNARDVLQACYDSLCMAIEASKSAKNCK
ncbi:MAG: hypothetical protein IPN76_17900 [Saprospiraceae bacterium]|nr:hypothetical protein [Saprospiraceae bacterium]